jgi:hypothetical protein
MTELQKKLALVAVAVVSFLAALEVGLRIAPVAIPLEILEQFEPELRSAIAERRKLTTKKDPVLVERDDGGPPDRLWVYRPGAEVHWDFVEPGIVQTIRVDDMGFCNPTPDAYRREQFDVVTIGDSFTFCTTVDPVDTWSNVLGEISGLTVYNLGQPGRGPHEYVQLLKRFGLARRPRVVVMNVYEGNDFRDAYLFHEARLQAGGGAAPPPCPFGSQPLCSAFLAIKRSPIGRLSYAYNFLAGSVWWLAASARQSEIDFQYEVRFADGGTLGMNSRNGDRDEVEFARMLVDGTLGGDLLEDALSTFVSLARDYRFTPIVVYTPSAYTAYEGMTTFDDPTIEATMRAYSRGLRAYFAGAAERLKFEYVDLTETINAAARSSRRDALLYFQTNVHLTPAGHRLVAERVARAIAENTPQS